MNRIKFEGLPGTGKTTTILNILKNLDLGKTVVCTFGKQMAEELKQRIGDDSSYRGSLKNVSTIHSLCMRLSQIHSDQVITLNDQKEISDSFGLDFKFNGKFIDPMDTSVKAPGNVMFDMHSWLNNNLKTIDDISEYPNFMRLPKTIDIGAFLDEYKQYKETNDKYDFSDMLNIVMEDNLLPDCQNLMVDEFQDLTPSQYKIFQNWEKNMENVFIAGDPYQCIYSFFGGSPDFFNKWNGELQILPETRRFGENTMKFAREILENAGYEDIPNIKATGKTNDVRVIDSYEYLDEMLPNFNSNTFHLVRCKYMAFQISKRLSDAGIPFMGEYGWNQEDINIYNGIYSLKTEGRINRPCLHSMINVYPDNFFNAPQNKVLELIDKTQQATFDLKDIKKYTTQNNLFGNSFVKSITDKLPLEGSDMSDSKKTKILNAIDKYNKPISETSVYLGTIHSVKGKEADNVFVWNELSRVGKKTIMSSNEGLKSESMVWFVAATRAKKNLVWVNANSSLRYGV